MATLLPSVRSGGRCVELTGTGGPDRLCVAQRPVPRPGPGEVALRVEAAGVAFADVKMRHGIYPGAPAFPFVPGYDVAGTVTEVGPGVSGLAVGDRVAGLSFVGGYAQHVALEARYVARISADVDAAQAAALVLNYVTAWQMLERVAKVPAGGSILVHGGAGGVGTALLELARARGVRALATASAGKHALVRELGGDPIDYRTEDFVTRAREIGGVDAVFDHVGGWHLWRSRKAAKPGGTVVGYGFAGAVGAASEAQVVRQTYMAFAACKLAPGPKARFYAILTRPFDQSVHISADLKHLAQMLDEGRLAPRIGARFPLDQAGEAHALMEASGTTGKIVLECG
ncbi:MAG: medium chain dehydrogenase/reductase family protein [Pseudomonadota bacterium]